MILADTHLHSSFSGDSKSPMKDYIDKSIHLGLKHLCFTEHYDLYYPESELADGSFGNIFLINMPEYISTAKEMKKNYYPDINVLAGIELGLNEKALPKYQDILKSYPFDFVLASIHLVDGFDPYYPDFWLYHDSKEGIKMYFETMANMLEKYDNFDSLAHLDYIFRYVVDEAGNPAERNYSYSKYADFIEPILKKLISMGKALEVNTGGYRHELGVPNPQPEVLKRYLELGGTKITIGSDAHHPKNLAHSFEVCEDLLKGIGFQYYEVYENRTPIQIAL